MHSDTPGPELNLPYATNRADFMRDEGTAMFTHLARVVLPDLFGIGTSEDITKPARNAFLYRDVRSPFALALGIAETHANVVRSALGTDFHQIHKHVNISGASMPTEAYTILHKLTEHTYYRFIPPIMQEAYRTSLAFPLRLLEYADFQARVKHRLPPVIHKYDDFAAAYRSPWLQEACTVAALTPNGIWAGFSVDFHTSGPLVDSVLDLDFWTENDNTRFGFSDKAVRLLRDELRKRNAQRIKSVKKNGPELIDSSTHGSSSGCPVAHDKPGLRPTNPSDAARLNAVAWIVGAPAEELMVPEKNGIVYGMEAAATLFERCAPLIRELVNPTENQEGNHA